MLWEALDDRSIDRCDIDRCDIDRCDIDRCDIDRSAHRSQVSAVVWAQTNDAFK